jgi:hypothetical protein
MKISRRGLSPRSRIYTRAALMSAGRASRVVPIRRSRLSVRYGASPKVIWIRSGNCSTADIIRLLRHRRDDIDSFPADPETSFLAIA